MRKLKIILMVKLFSLGLLKYLILNWKVFQKAQTGKLLKRSLKLIIRYNKALVALHNHIQTSDYTWQNLKRSLNSKIIRLL